MGCYKPTIIKIYEVPGQKKKIPKLEKLILDNFDKIYMQHMNQWEPIITTNEKGEQIKQLAHCINVIQVPCGNCTGCALDHARNWQTRLMCENEYHKIGYFLTITYDELNIPSNYQVNKQDAQQFIKALQNYAYRNNIKDFKYYLVAEYGGKTGRPHYHAIIWGINLKNDLKRHSKTQTGNTIFESKLMNNLWAKGGVMVGELTPESVGYVCRYAVKKQTLTRSKKKDLKDKGIQSEFMLCSKGLGYQYYIDNFDKIVKYNGVFYINGKKLHTERTFKKIADKLGRTKEAEKIIEHARYMNTIKRHNSIVHNAHKNLNELLNEEEIEKLNKIDSLKRLN